MYDAPLLALGLVAMLPYRALMKRLEYRYHQQVKVSSMVLSREDAAEALLGHHGSNMKTHRVSRVLLLIFHYYTPLYVVLTWLFYLELSGWHALVSRTDLLDPVVLREQFASEHDLPDWWQNELQYTLGGSGFLRALSLVTPFCIVGTFAVTVYNTLRHVVTVHKKGGGICRHVGHDSTICIIALPLVYGLMSFKSVGRMWMIISNGKDGLLSDIVDFERQHTWLGRMVMCQLMYETNFMVGDLYEAIALYQFAWLTLNVVASHKSKQAEEVHQRYRRSRTVSAAMDGFEQAQQGLTKLALQGIYLFVACCLMEAVYYLFTTSVEVYIGEPALAFTMAVQRIKEKVHFFFVGCGFFASSAAIGNVVTVELTFEEFLEEFKPAWKFWSTKILVSFAFLQSMLLYVPGLNTMSVTEGNLFYASLLCIECFGVSILHLHAWDPKQAWYEQLMVYRDRELEKHGS